MLDKLPKLWLLALVPLCALAFIIGAFFFYHRGTYEPPPAVALPIDQINRLEASPGDFIYVPGVPLRDGLLLVDTAHSNSFEKGEIVTLLSRVADQGYDIEFVPSSLEEKLRGADSLAVILPRDPYSREEAGLVERFVQKGGKLLLIADPTRRHDINSLARQFGLDFQPDYLFNQVEYDLNFRDIFIRDFQADDLTRGLREIVLYTAGSIRSSGPGLAITDQNTRSSMVERVEPFYPIAMGSEGKVLAIFDLTFMIPPQDSLSDNGQLVSNLADFLTPGQREFELADFPRFFEGEVDILLGQPSFVDLGTEFKSKLAGRGVDSQIRGIEDLARDAVFIGLYEDSPRVSSYLEAAGIQIGESIGVPSSPDLPPVGTSIILLNRSQDRHVLVILAQSAGNLQDTVKLLFSGDFRTGLVDDLVGVYQTE
jgi:hypothetical protein